MKTVKTEPNQTVFDLAVQHYGNPEAVGEIIANNPGIRNDPETLSQIGIDYTADSGFYLDCPILIGTEIKIDSDSKQLRKSVTKELKRPITTFEYGTDN